MKQFNALPLSAKIAIYIVVGVVVLYIIYRIYKNFQAPVNAAYVPGAPVPIGWTPTTITDNLYDVIQGVFTLTSTKDDQFNIFNALNDNQMIAVYNDWQNRYANTKSYLFFTMGSLTQAVSGEQTCYVEFGSNACPKDVLLANLHRLQLP